MIRPLTNEGQLQNLEDLPLEKYEVQENFPLKLYEYDSALTFEENLYRKVYLKQYGK